MITFQHFSAPTYSPWGQPDRCVKLADGIWDISTPSHGGFYVSPERLATMPENWLNLSFNGQGRKGWFEEDVDWSMVALAFPDEWKAYHGEERGTELLEAAKNTFNYWIAKKETA